MSRITRSQGPQQTEPFRPNEVVTDNKDPDKLNHSVPAQENQANLTGEAKGMLDLGGVLVKKSLENALESGQRTDTNNVAQSGVGTALGYGGKLGIRPSRNSLE